MPSYEFVCRQCQERFTVMVPYSQKRDVRCPRCNGDNLQELFGLGLIGAGSKNAAANDSCSFG